MAETTGIVYNTRLDGAGGGGEEWGEVDNMSSPTSAYILRTFLTSALRTKSRVIAVSAKPRDSDYKLLFLF